MNVLDISSLHSPFVISSSICVTLPVGVCICVFLKATRPYICIPIIQRNYTNEMSIQSNVVRRLYGFTFLGSIQRASTRRHLLWTTYMWREALWCILCVQVYSLFRHQYTYTKHTFKTNLDRGTMHGSNAHSPKAQGFVFSILLTTTSYYMFQTYLKFNCTMLNNIPTQTQIITKSFRQIFANIPKMQHPKVSS